MYYIQCIFSLSLHDLFIFELCFNSYQLILNNLTSTFIDVSYYCFIQLVLSPQYFSLIFQPLQLSDIIKLQSMCPMQMFQCLKPCPVYHEYGALFTIMFNFSYLPSFVFISKFCIQTSFVKLLNLNCSAFVQQLFY